MSFAAAQKLATEGGEALAIGSRTLHKRLDERKVLASTAEPRNRLVVRRTLEGRRREVLHLAAAALWDEKTSHA